VLIVLLDEFFKLELRGEDLLLLLLMADPFNLHLFPVELFKSLPVLLDLVHLFFQLGVLIIGYLLSVLLE